MSITSIWQLAQFKLASECMREDHNLLLIVGHANLLYTLAASEHEQTLRFEREFPDLDASEAKPGPGQSRRAYTMNERVAQHAADPSLAGLPYRGLDSASRESRQNEVGRVRDSGPSSHSKPAPPKRSRRRRPRHAVPMVTNQPWQDKSRREISVVQAPDGVQESHNDPRGGRRGGGEASMLAFIEAETRLDKELDQLFESRIFGTNS